MRRTVEKTLGLAVATSVVVGVAHGDGPELAPPSEMPALARPKASIAPRPKTAAPAAGRDQPVLALPGITTPSSRRPSVITSIPSSRPTAELPSLPDGPQLDGPLEMPAEAPTPRAGSAAGRAGRTIPLEPLPIDESPSPAEPEARTSPADRSTRNPPRTSPPMAPVVRRGRFFGLGGGPTVAPPASSAPGRSVAEKPEDAAADAALKRRIEKQAREFVGDRVRSLDVRVAGKDVSIRARGIRLFQKRAVRRSLESLPALSGLRSSIFVDD